MISVKEPEVVHEIAYRTSGSSSPREMTLSISTVRYSNDGGPAPAFLATADLQGREKHAGNRLLGELAAEEILTLQELGVLPSFELCVLCGDFYDYPDLRKLGGTGDVTPAFNALSRTAAKTFAVLGNHDIVNRTELRPEITILDGDVVATDSFTIGGVSGIIGNPKRNQRKKEADFVSAIEKCSNKRVSLLLLHQGPSGAIEAQRGADSVNEILRRRANLLVLFGHCHWQEPFHQEARNLFCNVDARIFAFIPDSKP